MQLLSYHLAVSLTTRCLSRAGSEPIPDAITVNGVVGTLGTVRGGHGLHFVAPPRGRSLIRFISAAAFSVFNVSIDGCALSVVEIDGTAVAAQPVSWFTLNIGQRVAVIVDWAPVAGRRWGASGVFMRIWAMAQYYASPLSYVPPYGEEGEVTTAAHRIHSLLALQRKNTPP